MSKQKKLINRWIGLPIKENQHYKRMGLNTSTGIILYGMPGVGKTMLMEAISGELQIPMMDIKIAQVLTRWIGGSEKKLQKIFEQAKNNQPCILFFDEIDVLAASRDKGEGGYGAALQSITGAFLKEISEVMKDKNSLIFLVGATNRPYDVDDAIKRSGRFENVIYVRPPNLLERRKLFKHYLEKSKQEGYTKHINYFLLGLATIGYSPADIEKVSKAAQIEVIKAINKKQKPVYLNTHHIQLVLCDKEIARSSLDESYLKIKSEYIGKTKRKGFIPYPWREKVQVGKQPKFSKAELEIYKEMVKETNSYMRYRLIYNTVRFLARGINIW